MDYHLALERVAEQADVAVGLIGAPRYGQAVAAGEELGVPESEGESHGVLTDIAGDGIEAAVGQDDLVVEAALEDAVGEGVIVDAHLERRYLAAEDLIEFGLDVEGDMQVVGHEGVLEEAERGMDVAEFAQGPFDGGADRGGLEIGGASRADGDIAVAGDAAEGSAGLRLAESQMVEASRLIVVPAGAKQEIQGSKSFKG